MSKTQFFSLMPSLKKKLKDLIRLSIGGACTFLGIGIYKSNEDIYQSFIMPALHKLDPETAHRCCIILAKYRLVPSQRLCESEILKTKEFGLSFANPVGIAAGFDKNGEAVEGLFKMGFGFVEVGSVTPHPQPGNEKPRIFRLTEVKGIINRCGFNSDGHDAVYERLSRLNATGKRNGILGVNLGKNKDSDDPVHDYVLGVQKFGDIADYLVINVSSPNTPGLRKLQGKTELGALVTAVLKARDGLSCGNHKPALLLKISPDLSLQEKEDIARIVVNEKTKIDGLIISNTTLSRPDNVNCDHLYETGGLSGEPLKNFALQTMKDMALLTKGKIPIIGVGGISSGQDALDYIYHGASLVQLYTAFIYKGPPLIKQISSELHELLRRDGYEAVSEAVGSKLSIETRSWWQWWW